MVQLIPVLKSYFFSGINSCFSVNLYALYWGPFFFLNITVAEACGENFLEVITAFLFPSVRRNLCPVSLVVNAISLILLPIGDFLLVDVLPRAKTWPRSGLCIGTCRVLRCTHAHSCFFGFEMVLLYSYSSSNYGIRRIASSNCCY